MNGPPAVCLFLLCLLAGTAIHAQQGAASTQTPSHPFFIKQTWVIGGNGPWDYLTLDAAANRLYIAHGHSVQVVDVTTGALAGEITGLVEAHAIALDDSGEFGYISDGPAAKVIVFDRRTFAAVAAIDDVPSPRSLVYDPQTRLLFAVRDDPGVGAAQPTVPRTTTHITTRPVAPPASQPSPKASSFITVIDTQTEKIAGRVLLAGSLGFAQADGRGDLYVSVTDRNQILRLDTQSIAGLLSNAAQPAAAPQPGADAAPSGTPLQPGATGSKQGTPPATPAQPVTIDWRDSNRPARSISVAGECATPKSLAIDAAHSRLFAACNNLKLLVLNADDGNVVATLPIGPGVDAIGYDPGNNLIYSANGGADGSLTIISQSVTDSYAVIQTLATRQRARTLAVNPGTGQVYLVTDLLGVNLAQPGPISAQAQTGPVNGTFQVLVVGN